MKITEYHPLGRTQAVLGIDREAFERDTAELEQFREQIKDKER
jgi:hypothetical protein